MNRYKEICTAFISNPRFLHWRIVDIVRPCGNVMLSSLSHVSYDEIICVILTGMGADGTKGTQELAKHKPVYVIAQDEASSTVYGMPKAIRDAGLCDCVCDLQQIAEEITKKVGVQEWI